jgi:hypothetical protein
MTLRHSARLHRRTRQGAARQLPPPPPKKIWKTMEILENARENEEKTDKSITKYISFHFNISNFQMPPPPLEGIKPLRNLVPRVSPSVLWPLRLCAPAH